MMRLLDILKRYDLHIHEPAGPAYTQPDLFTLWQMQKPVATLACRVFAFWGSLSLARPPLTGSHVGLGGGWAVCAV